MSAAGAAVRAGGPGAGLVLVLVAACVRPSRFDESGPWPALRGELVKRFLEVVADPSSHPERAELIAQVAQLDSVAYQVLWEMADARGLTPPDVIPPWQRD